MADEELTYAELVEEILRITGWTATRLAEECRVKPPAIHFWRTGQNHPIGPSQKVLEDIFYRAKREQRERVIKADLKAIDPDESLPLPGPAAQAFLASARKRPAPE